MKRAFFWFAVAIALIATLAPASHAEESVVIRQNHYHPGGCATLYQTGWHVTDPDRCEIEVYTGPVWLWLDGRDVLRFGAEDFNGGAMHSLHRDEEALVEPETMVAIRLDRSAWNRMILTEPEWRRPPPLPPRRRWRW